MAKALRSSIKGSLKSSINPGLLALSDVLWTPARLPGLQLWLDADDDTTITLTGNRITGWDDKSGNGNNASQGVVGNSPTYNTATINSKKVVNFSAGTGSRRFMTTPYPPALNRTIGAVVRYSTVSGLTPIMGAREALNERSYFGASNGTVRIGVGDKSTLNGNSVSTSVTYTQILKHGDETGSKKAFHYLDGTNDIVNQDFGGDIGSDQNYMIGGFNDAGSIHVSTYGGLVAELVITNNMMSDSDRQKLEGYFAHNWGHAASLPADHPYKSSAPTV